MEEETILAVAYATRRSTPWETIMGAFNIKYIPYTSVKSQVLMDLVAEIAQPPSNEKTEAQHMDGKLVGMVSLHRTLCLEGYILMVLQIKGDPKWG